MCNSKLRLCNPFCEVYGVMVLQFVNSREGLLFIDSGLKPDTTADHLMHN